MCAREMFKLIETTGQLCDITGFHLDLPSIKDIPIDTTEAALDHSDRKT